jgi:hypothetical protein
MKLRTPSPRMLVGAICTLAVAYFALWACAPTMTLPPPVPFARNETGEYSATLAASALGYYNPVGVETQFGYTWNRSGLPDFGLQAYAGTNTNLGLGLSLRQLFRPSERFAWGLAAQAGWLYATASVPLSYRLGEHSWVWLQPSLGLDMTGPIGVSGGASLNRGGKHRFNVELGLRALGYTEIWYPRQWWNSVPLYAFVGLGYSARTLRGKRRD